MEVVSPESLNKGASPVSVSFDQTAEKSKLFYFQIMIKPENVVSLGFIKAALDLQDTEVSCVRKNGADYISLTGKSDLITREDEAVLRDHNVIESGMYMHKPPASAIVNTHYMFSRSKKPSGLIAKIG